MSRSKGHPGGKGSANDGDITITLGSLTHVGMTRSANQDAYSAILAPNAPPGTDALLAVADGMGGHQAGEVASAMAIQGLAQRHSPRGTGNVTPMPQQNWSAFLGDVIQQLNAEIFQAGKQPQTQGMGTTLTVALLAGSSLAVAHVGDSRLYLLRNGRLQQLSKDHSWVAEEVARGAFTPEEARTHPRRNILTQALGTTPTVQVDTSDVPIQEGDTLLLCSDGLHSLVTDQEIAQILASESPQAASQALVDRANSLGGNDNVTVIVARLERGKTGASARQQRRADDVKTVTIKAKGGPRRSRGAGRLLLRILLSPILLLYWFLKVGGRGLWALLKLLFRRRR